MPINFLEGRERNQHLGRVRLGILTTNKNGVTYPEATPHFVLTSAPDIALLCGEECPITLQIEFLWDRLEGTLPHYLRRYKKSGLQCLGDGERVMYRLHEQGHVDARDGNSILPNGKVEMDRYAMAVKVACDGQGCSYYKSGDCKPTGFLRFMASEALRLGFYDVVCHQLALTGMLSQLKTAKEVFGRITDMPWLLHRGEVEQVAVKTPKGMVKMPVRTQWIEIEPEWFAENYPRRHAHKAQAQDKVRQDVIDLFGDGAVGDDEEAPLPSLDDFTEPTFSGEEEPDLTVDKKARELLNSDAEDVPQEAPEEPPQETPESDAPEDDAPVRTGESKWNRCSDLINRARSEIRYYGDNAPHIISALNKLETLGKISWTGSSVEAVFDALNAYAHEQANGEAANG